jgi:hypothetical protein
MPGRLDDAHMRVDRAEMHLANLKRRADRYVKANEGQAVIKVVGLTVSGPPTFDPPPRFLGILLGETVQNLRTALDYLVYQLAEWYSGVDLDRRTQFPIEDTPESFQGKRNSFLEGVSDEHVAILDALQPYDRPNWLTWIRELSNLDKHNVLVVAPGIRGSVTIPVGRPDEEAIAAGGFRKPGDVGMYFKVPIYIAFGDGLPVIEQLEELKAQTRALLQLFEPELERERIHSP